MPELKTVIFVDGQNFKRNLQQLQFLPNGADVSERKYRLDEKHFLWQKFFQGLISKVDEHTDREHTLIRAYWYNAGEITPFYEQWKYAEIISKRHIDKLPELTRGRVMELAKEWYNRERRNFDAARQKVLEQIQRRTDFLEFKYIGQYVVKPFKDYKLETMEDGTVHYQGTRLGEKGVDLGMAIDMVAMMPNYDVAVLLSGDADFVPVVRYIKNNLKYVYQFSLAKGVPPSINYLSPWLKSIVDVFEYFDERELLSGYLDRNSGIPPQILASIDTRIEELERLSRDTTRS
jgi:uncharacterized LabA/DUF88 family protein